MSRCARVAAVLLLHVNLLLMLFSGAMLATAARLKWDPVVYVPARWALPSEYRAACALLPALAAATAALAHAALAALTASPRETLRRPVLFTYGAVTIALVVSEVSTVVWAALRVAPLVAAAQEHMRDQPELMEHVMASLEILARMYPFFEQVVAMLEEVISDVPVNGYVAGVAALALVSLQTGAAALALLAAAPRPPPPRRPHTRTDSLATLASAATASSRKRNRSNYYSEASMGSERAPLKTAYKNGRLVIL